MIKKEGNKWVLYTHDGKQKLGTHNTYKEAIQQELIIKKKKKNKETSNQCTCCDNPKCQHNTGIYRG